jgi:hypothetical protein
MALAAGLSFSVSFPASVQPAPQDGRLILLISRKAEGEPRHQVTPESALPNPYIFGRNVSGLKPGQSAVIDASAFGWPARSPSNLKAGCSERLSTMSANGAAQARASRMSFPSPCSRKAGMQRT